MSLKEDAEDFFDEETLFAEGFDDALIGVIRQFNRVLALYDYDKCVHILQTRDNMTREDAEEYLEYNVLGSWVGEYTPCFTLLMKND